MYNTIPIRGNIMNRLELSVNLNKIWLLGDLEARNKIISEYFYIVKDYLLQLGVFEDLDNLSYQLIDTIIDDYFSSKNSDFEIFLRKDIKKVLESKNKNR